MFELNFGVAKESSVWWSSFVLMWNVIVAKTDGFLVRTESGCYCYTVIRIVLNNSDIISQWIACSQVPQLHRLCSVCQYAHINTHEHFNVIKYIKWDSIFRRTGSIAIGNENKAQNAKHNTRSRICTCIISILWFFHSNSGHVLVIATKAFLPLLVCEREYVNIARRIERLLS